MKHIKNLVKILLVSLVGFLFFGVVVVNAFDADFGDKKGDVVSTEETRNFYTAGRLVDVSGRADGDLVVIGGEVNISSPQVLGSIIVAAGEVDLNSNVQEQVQVLGEKIVVSGKFSSDVKLYGAEVVVKDAVFEKDLKVYADSLVLENSLIKGALRGKYSNTQSDLKSQVFGGYKIEQGDIVANILFLKSSGGEVVKTTWQIGNLVLLLVVSIFLIKRNRLWMPQVKFDKRFGKDLLRGFLSIIMPAFVLIFSIFTLTFFQVSLLTTTIYIFLGISSIFVPIYLASFLKNTFKMEHDIRVMLVVGYLIVLLLRELSWFGTFLYVVLVVANFGFLWGSLKRTLNRALSKKVD